MSTRADFLRSLHNGSLVTVADARLQGRIYRVTRVSVNPRLPGNGPASVALTDVASGEVLRRVNVGYLQPAEGGSK